VTVRDVELDFQQLYRQEPAVPGQQSAPHASCFAMAFSNTLAEQGNEPEELNVSAVCTFDAGQLKVTSSVLHVRGKVSGLDAEGFQNAAEQAEQGCPVSNALRGNVDIQVNASLD